MTKKINPSFKCCEENYKRKNNPVKQEIGASCFYNLFARCWFEEKDDFTVDSALNGNTVSMREIHSRINQEKRLSK